MALSAAHASAFGANTSASGDCSSSVSATVRLCAAPSSASKKESTWRVTAGSPSR